MDEKKSNAQIDHKLSILGSIASAFDQQGIVWALGGSMMLFLRGMDLVPRDLDLMVDTKDAQAAKALLGGLGIALQTPASDRFCSAAFERFLIQGVEVDLIAGFTILKDGREHAFPLHKKDIDAYEAQGLRLPLHAVDSWKQLYAVMDRPAKLKEIEEAQAAGCLHSGNIWGSQHG